MHRGPVLGMIQVLQGVSGTLVVQVRLVFLCRQLPSARLRVAHVGERVGDGSHANVP
jgi:hypothetical protein